MVCIYRRHLSNFPLKNSFLVIVYDTLNRCWIYFIRDVLILECYLDTNEVSPYKRNSTEHSVTSRDSSVVCLRHAHQDGPKTSLLSSVSSSTRRVLTS